MNQKQILREEKLSPFRLFIWNKFGINSFSEEVLEAIENYILQTEEETVKAVIQEDENGENVQAPCPDLRPGCAVYHTEFRMTHEAKTRNNMRKEMRARYSQIRKARE